MDKGVPKRNAGVSENNGVSEKTGIVSLAIAIGRGVLDLLGSLIGTDCGVADIVSVEGVRIVDDAVPQDDEF